MGVVFDYALFFSRRDAERFVSRKVAKEQKRKEKRELKGLSYLYISRN